VLVGKKLIRCGACINDVVDFTVGPRDVSEVTTLHERSVTFRGQEIAAQNHSLPESFSNIKAISSDSFILVKILKATIFHSTRDVIREIRTIIPGI
jgi:hypothetical protein